MTDSQRNRFDEKIIELLNTIKKETNGEQIENFEQIDKWSRNLYLRYKYSKENVSPRYALPQDNMEILKQRLKEQNITEEEYELTKGSIKKLASTLKEKNKNISLEELMKLREELVEKINMLKQQQTKKYIQLYNLTNADIKAIEQELKICKNKKNEINKIIESKQKQENQKNNQENLIEENKEQTPTQPRKFDSYNQKITKLMETNKEQSEEIKELEGIIENYETEKKSAISKIQENYDKRLDEKQQQLEKEYIEKLEAHVNEITKKYDKQLKEKDAEIERQKQELENQPKEFVKQFKEIKEKQKQAIVKLLCKNDNVKIEDIRTYLKNEKEPTEGLTDTLKELKNEIPGIVRGISEDGLEQSYSIKIDAIKQLEEYKKLIISPRISNIQDGIVSFIVCSDIHLNMKNSEEIIKKTLFPFIEYSAKNNNIPIIDLGDIAETIREIGYNSWKTMDKNTIKQAYNFYVNYAKAIASAPEIGHYTLFGNHDEHPYHSGIDPLEIILEHSNNFKLLGISSGSFKVGNDKIGVYHDKQWQNNIFNCSDKNEYIYNYLCEEAENFAKDYIYSLIGHYHFGKHNPELNFSVINNGIGSPLLFTAEVKDGYVERMYVTELYLINNTQYKKSNYQTEIYNRQRVYKK